MMLIERRSKCTCAVMLVLVWLMGCSKQTKPAKEPDNVEPPPSAVKPSNEKKDKGYINPRDDSARAGSSVPRPVKQDPAPSKENPTVLIKTSMGDILVELDPKHAPITVKNFLQYVDDKHYDNTLFHRVALDYVIQGGGFTPSFQKKPTKGPIRNEADNGLVHVRGTIAMARTPVVHSAQDQFFINLKRSPHLNHRGTHPRLFGYAVFGKVKKGMDVVDRINKVATGPKGPFPKECPLTDVVIRSIRRVAQSAGSPKPDSSKPDSPKAGSRKTGSRKQPRKGR